MTRLFNPYLNSNGLYLRDWQHAARLYVDDVYRLAPKPKWLHYTVFNLNEAATSGTAFQQQNRNELNYLVKKMDLPRYTLNTENLNQYNRKTTTYTRITYEPINIVFHDDNNGVTNALWAMYYSHYFADRLNSQTPYEDVNPPAYQNHAYDAKSAFPYRYGLDVSSSRIPFFNSIQLLTLTKHKFSSYLLCHPRITAWQHDTMDQSEGNGVVENNMTVAYDAVIYTTGTITFDNPSGFGMLHYDRTPSPLGPENAQFLQGAVANLVAEELINPNPFNPIDLGISIVNSARQLSLTGNLAPYGNNISAPLLPNVLSSYNTFATRSTSGFQTYDFGGAIEPVNEQLFNAPIEVGFNNGSAARLEAITEEFRSTGDGYLRNSFDTPVTTSIVSDVYQNNLPDTTISSQESKIFNDYNSGINLPETNNPVNIDYFTQADIPNINSIPNTELINNNPQFFDVPDNPFE